MNKVFLVGRLTRDPELRYTSSNLATMRCAIAVDRQFVREGEERGTDFINIVAFGNRAETMSKYLAKGSQVAIDGRIQNFQFLDSKGSRNIEDMPTDNDIPNNDTTDSSDPFADFGAKIEVSDSELPF